MAEDTAPVLEVDIVSDVMCPWCFVGKRNLASAVSNLAEIDVKVSWRPFQLDPTLPPEGKDRRQYIRDKFGDAANARAIHERVEEAGRSAGIEFNFDAIAVSPNTLDAHRLIRWAGDVNAETQDRVVERLFQLYFIEGANVGDTDILVSAAETAGMDAESVRDLLASDRDREAVIHEIAVAQHKGVTGVPCFIIDNRYAVMGAQPPQVLMQAIRQAFAERREVAQYAPD